MKITAFNGSPKAEKGNTHVMVSEFLEGAKEAGAEVENVFLIKKDIKHCLGCFSCWTKTLGICVINDDMKELLEKYRNSDILVFASPVYVGLMTGVMKTFFDRFIPLLAPDTEGGKLGANYKTVKTVVIANCGNPSMSMFKHFRGLFEMLKECSALDVIGEIYRTRGDLLTSADPALQESLENYKKLLRQAGKEVVEISKISDETKAKLEEPLVQTETVVET